MRQITIAYWIALAGLLSCNGNGGNGPDPVLPAVTVSVNPAVASIQTGQTQTFTAAVTGSTNTAVAWSVVEAGGGSITAAGLYTAPGSAGTYHVQATSAADASRSAQAKVAVSPAAGPLPVPLADVRYWGYQIQGMDAPGAIDNLAASNYDLLVVEPTQTAAAMTSFDTAAMVRRLQESSAHDGAHRKRILAYIDIGEAESWRWYRTWPGTTWTLADWRRGVPRPAGWPSYIIYPDPDGWADNYPVAYWDPAWKAIVMGGIPAAGPGGAHGLIDEAILAGFDGIYLDWVEGFDDAEVRKAAQLAGVDPAVEMIRFIGEMKAYARQRNPGFLVIQQNATALAEGHPELYGIIDGLGQEDTWWGNVADVGWDDPRGYDSAPQDPAYTSVLLSRFSAYRAAGVPVFTIDYAVAHAPEVYAEAARLGLVPYCTRSSLEHLTTTPPPGY